MTELASMAMGAATTASGEASPTEMPGYTMYGKKSGDGANGHSPDHRSPKDQPIIEEDDDSPGDVNRPPALVIADLDHDASPLRGLYKLRKNRSFCDVILQVTSRTYVMSATFASRQLPAWADCFVYVVDDLVSFRPFTQSGCA